MKTFDEIVDEQIWNVFEEKLANPLMLKAVHNCMRQAVKVALEEVCNASNATYITYIVSDEGYDIPVININAIMSVLEEMEA